MGTVEKPNAIPKGATVVDTSHCLQPTELSPPDLCDMSITPSQQVERRKRWKSGSVLVPEARKATAERRKMLQRQNRHAKSLFLFPIVFGINLILFFDEKGGAAGNSIVCFGASIPCHAI